jgi:hypothetical protein
MYNHSILAIILSKHKKEIDKIVYSLEEYGK